MGKKITDHNYDKYVTTPKCNKLTSAKVNEVLMKYYKFSIHKWS